jgi:ubiquinone/menaquinone biosynthesis C-methylase UbiE
VTSFTGCENAPVMEAGPADGLAGWLRCPGCGGELGIAETTIDCTACGAAFPYDRESGVASLMAESSTTAKKADLQAWWGDLYRQAYLGHEDGVDADAFDRQLSDVEDLFRRRGHLATEEMPLGDLAGKRVLEIGSGSGAHSALFKRYGAVVTAVDITAERVAATSRKLRLTTGEHGLAYQADAENLPFRDGVFDIVYSNGVLHHSPDTEQCIAEVYRVLKPGGRAVIMLYSRHSAQYWLNIVPRAVLTGEMFRWPEAQWIGRLTEGKPKFGTTKNPFTRVYSRRAMVKLFRRFRVVSLRKNSFQFDNFCVPRLSQVRRWLLTRLGRQAHPGGILVYGQPFVPETALELRLGRYFGFAWNIVAEKPGPDGNA